MEAGITTSPCASCFKVDLPIAAASHRGCGSWGSCSAAFGVRGCGSVLARNMHNAAFGVLGYLYFRQNFPHFLCLKNQPAWFWVVQKQRLSLEELDLFFALIPSWVSSQQPGCCGHCAPVMDAGCVQGAGKHLNILCLSPSVALVARVG